MRRYDVRFVLKADDDAFINVPSLVRELKAHCLSHGCRKERMYFGREIRNNLVRVAAGDKWQVIRPRSNNAPPKVASGESYPVLPARSFARTGVRLLASRAPCLEAESLPGTPATKTCNPRSSFSPSGLSVLSVDSRSTQRHPCREPAQDVEYLNHTSLKTYFPYMMGGGYVLSADLAAVILGINQQSRGHDLLKFMPNEDVSVGFWLMSVDLRRIDHQRVVRRPSLLSLPSLLPRQLHGTSVCAIGAGLTLPPGFAGPDIDETSRLLLSNCLSCEQQTIAATTGSPSAPCPERPR